MKEEFGVSRCKLLHLEGMNSKVLLYSTGNYIQSLGIDHMEDNMRKRIYIYYIPLGLDWNIQQKLTNIVHQVCFNKKFFFKDGRDEEKFCKFVVFADSTKA